MGVRDSKNKLGLWLSTFISIAGLLLIVLIAYIFEKAVNHGFNKNLLTVISVVIAVIPPILWLTIFYRQDRLNPEPKSLVFKTLILGALVHKAVYTPLISWVLPQSSKGSASISGKLITAIVITAIIQEAVKLLSVRYSVYSSREFDEAVDGIIYGSALGLGFAAMSSIDTIFSAGGAMLTNVTSLVVIENFSHASITGLSGYILGISKHKKFNVLWLPFALVLSSALNALVHFLLNTVVRQGFKVNYIIGLIPAALVAVIVFGVLVMISSRHEKAGGEEIHETLGKVKAITGDLPVWVLLILTVAAGLLVNKTAGRIQTQTIDNIIEIQYPSSWIQSMNENEVFKAADMVNNMGQEFVCVKKLPLNGLMNVEGKSEEEKLQNAAAAWTIKSGMNYRFYQPEDGYYTDARGKESYVINYTYIKNGQASSGANKADIGYGRDILCIYGSDLYIITISSRYENYILNGNKLINVNYSFN